MDYVRNPPAEAKLARTALVSRNTLRGRQDRLRPSTLKRIHLAELLVIDERVLIQLREDQHEAQCKGWQLLSNALDNLVIDYESQVRGRAREIASLKYGAQEES